MNKFPFKDLGVAAVIDNYPPKIRKKLLQLRDLVFLTAQKTKEAGPLLETLKWGQPSYLTPVTKSGTTIRIDKIKNSDDKIGIFVHCQTDLIEAYRKKFGKSQEFDGNRAIIFDIKDKLPRELLTEFIRSALTYHIKR